MNILEQIVAFKKEEIASLKKKKTITDFQSEELFHRTSHSLIRSLQQKNFGIIAEIKRASPSAGNVQPKIMPQEIAQQYFDNGAAGISVLTDEKYFHGSLSDLRAVRSVVPLPILRKDFILDAMQIYEAKANGADAILLIARILEQKQIEDLFLCAQELGLETLVELYDEREIEKLDCVRMKLIGINNRNLETFQIDIKRTVRIGKYLPADCFIVSESGIQSENDIQFLAEHNIRAALIGGYLMHSKNPGETLRNLLITFTNENTH